MTMKSNDFRMDDIDEELAGEEIDDDDDNEDDKRDSSTTSFVAPSGVNFGDNTLTVSAISHSSSLDDSKSAAFGFDTSVAEAPTDSENQWPEPEAPSTAEASYYSNNSSFVTPIVSNVKATSKDQGFRASEGERKGTRFKTSFPTRSGAAQNHKNGSNIHDDDATDALTLKRGSKRRCWGLMSLVAIFLATAAAVGGYCGLTEMCSSGHDTNRNGADVDDDHVDEVDDVDVVGETSMRIAAFINNSTFLKDTVINYPVKTQDATVEENALRWLIEEDPLDYSSILVPEEENEMTQFRLLQRYALALLLLQRTEVNAASDNVTMLFLSDDGASSILDECTWFGVTCQSSKNLGSGMGHPNAVTAMNFSDSDLDGSIPPDVALLEHLESFSASQTSSLRGTLPDSIGMWTNLRHFEVSSRSLSGTLPDSIAGWTSLETFDIGGCDWSGTLPQDIGQWTELQRFYIDAVAPAGLKAWFSDQALYREGFNGALPPSIGDWNKIQEVRMYGNSFTGNLPPTIGSWQNLTMLSIGGNSFTGPLPDDIGLWTNIEYFMVDIDIAPLLNTALSKLPWANDEPRQNQFSGTLPAQIAKWSRITDFSVYNNNFSGTLPGGLEKWKHLKSLNLAENHFNGPLFPQIRLSLWPDIVLADFHGNNFTGKLSPALEFWNQVVQARFHDNALVGTMPLCENKHVMNDNISMLTATWVKDHPILSFLDLDKVDVTADCTVSCDCCSQCF